MLAAGAAGLDSLSHSLVFVAAFPAYWNRGRRNIGINSVDHPASCPNSPKNIANPIPVSSILL